MMREPTSEELESVDNYIKNIAVKNDNIHPDHYKLNNNLEVIDFIEALGLGAGFELGNAIKYIARVGKKNGENEATTIDKAIWYLNRFKNKYTNID